MQLQNLTKNFIHFIAFFLMVFVSSVGNAADTEIYFSGIDPQIGVANEATSPNLLFILDTSQSMSLQLTGDPQNRSRIEVLRAVVQDILSRSNNVNLGFARFNTPTSGGSIIFPITNISARLSDVVGQANVNDYETFATADSYNPFRNPTFQSFPTIQDSFNIPLTRTEGLGDRDIILTAENDRLYVRTDADDASEDTGGVVQTVELSNGQSNDRLLNLGRDNPYVGLRFVFTPGTIQRCTTINSGTQLRVRNTFPDLRTPGMQTVRVWGQLGSTTSRFSNSNAMDISSRLRTTAMQDVSWDTGTPTGEAFLTVDIQSILQEIVNQGCATPGMGPDSLTDGTWDMNSIVFIIQYQSGSNVQFVSQNPDNSGNSTRADPRTSGQLDVNYTQSLSSLNLPPFAENDFRGTATPAIALRFEDINIPQGANIVLASLCYTSSVPKSLSGDPNPQFDVSIGLSDDAPATDLDDPLSVTTGSPAVTYNFDSSSTVNEGEMHCPSVNLNTLLEQVTDRAGWCGSNDITLIITPSNESKLYAQSTELNPNAFKLNYSYERTTNDGCWSADATNQVIAFADDAQQNGSGTSTEINSATIQIAAQESGYRFRDVKLDNGVTILSARLQFRLATAVTSGNGGFAVNGQLTGNADGFIGQLDNLTSRPKTTATVNADLPATVNAGQLFDVDVTAIVQEIVLQSNWTYDNAMAFLLSPSDIDTRYNVTTADSDLTNAARLNITYQSSGSIREFKTVRDRLSEIVNGIIADGATPIQETLYETARYWRGESMQFGNSRYNQAANTLSHPGTYCTAPGTCPNVTTGTDTGTIMPNRTVTDEFGVRTTTGALACDPLISLNTDACADQTITGAPVYLSPFSNTNNMCEANYQVLLTDGRQIDDSGDGTQLIKDAYGSFFNNSNCYASTTDFDSTSTESVTYSNTNIRKEVCMVDLVEMLNTRDQNSVLSGDQTVSTYTVSFDQQGVDPSSESSRRVLRDIASQGGGISYEANNADALATAFNEILFAVRNKATSFTAPSLATNAFNRLLSRDDVYFGLFQPETDLFWPGNVKKFDICISTSDGCTLGSILDANGNAATGTDNRFLNTARSHWSNVDDGNEITVGGAGAEILEHHQGNNTGTKIYTDIGGAGSGTPLSFGDTFEQSGYVYQESNNTSNNWTANDLEGLRSRICSPAPVTPVATTDPNYDDCRNRMQWLLGLDANNVNPDSNQRWTVADVLHSSPTVVTYGRDSNDPEVFYEKLIYTTNDGSFHMLNPDDNSGLEEWRYIPSELLTRQQTLFNGQQGSHPYGLDSTPVVSQTDNNGNGIIETANGDTVHVYFGMRRGGNNLYALDISATMTAINTPVTPKFLWKINGGTTPGFTRLTQTWSRPFVTNIATTTGPREVLIFGGGYDERLDNTNLFGTAASAGANNLGNAIYIVDSATGNKILSIGGNPDGDNNTHNNIMINEMRHSIPSELTVLSSNSNGLSDRIYFGDTGGNVWRIDLGDNIVFDGTTTTARLTPNPSDPNTRDLTTTLVGRLAQIADENDPTAYRRFFEPPSVVQVSDRRFSSPQNRDYDYVLIGTGYRAHPLDTSVADRFYAFRDRTIERMVPPQTSGSNIAKAYPVPNPVDLAGVGLPINHNTMGQLINVSTETLENIASNTNSNINVNASLGWYLDFNEINNSNTSGEKIFSAPVVLGGTVAFTTYVPPMGGITPPSDSCSNVQIGSGRAYNLNVLSTSAVLDWDASGNPISGRRKELGSGIPSDIIPVFTKEGVIGIVNYDSSSENLGKFADTPRFKTYWYNEL